MKNITLAILLALTAATAASAARVGEEEKNLVPEKENYSQMKMEARAIMGELKYQHGDMSGAHDTFKDSLNESTRLNAPQGQVMALDLFRTGELASRKGDFETARRHFEILIGRYPETEWAKRAEGLLSIFPRKRAEGLGEENATPVISGESPAFYLGRIRSAVEGGDLGEALATGKEFLERYPNHPTAPEIRLLAGAIYLRDGQAARAAKILRPVADQTRDPELKAKAIYLLGGALVDSGDVDGALVTVPAGGKGRWLRLAQVWRAAAMDRLGRRAEALKIYKQVLTGEDRSPVLAFARAALAAHAERAGKVKEALAALRMAGALADRFGLEDLSAACQLSVGHLFYRLHRFAESAEAYGDFARRRPDDPQRTVALYQQGLSYKRLGRRTEAVSAFQFLAERHPDSVYAADANLQLGQLFAQMGQSERAITHYKRMADGAPATGKAESELLVAQVHYNAKRYKEAIPLYTKYLEANPDDPRAKEVEDLLLTSYWLGDRDNPELLRAIERWPNHPIVAHIRWELAGTAYKKRDFGAAATAFARYAVDYPKSNKVAEALFYEGESHLKLGEPAAAVACYNGLIERFPKNKRVPEARQRLASALYQAGDYEASAKAYAKTGGADGAFNRAVALMKADDHAGALKAFEAFVKKYPRHPRASGCWIEIARLRETLGLPASDAYLKVPASDPNRAFAVFSAGRLREKAGRTKDAIAAYSLLRDARPVADPNRLRGLLRLGMMHELAGKRLPAMQAYAEVMRSAPRDGADFETARKRVESLTRK